MHLRMTSCGYLGGKERPYGEVGQNARSFNDHLKARKDYRQTYSLERYKVHDHACIQLFSFKTAFGGGRSTGFGRELVQHNQLCLANPQDHRSEIQPAGLIYESLDKMKKFEPKYRLKRACHSIGSQHVDSQSFLVMFLLMIRPVLVVRRPVQARLLCRRVVLQEAKFPQIRGRRGKKDTKNRAKKAIFPVMRHPLVCSCI